MENRDKDKLIELLDKAQDALFNKSKNGVFAESYRDDLFDGVKKIQNIVALIREEF